MVEVKIVEATESSEQTIVKAARGDYMEGSPWFDTSEVFENVSVDSDAGKKVNEVYVAQMERVGDDDESRAEPGVGVWSEERFERECAKFSLLRRLFRRGHFGPFEHVQVTVAMRGVPRVSMAQITRHRHATFDVQSMRYVNMENAEFEVPSSVTGETEATRGGVVELGEDDRQKAEQKIAETYELLRDRYEELCELGVPEEDARFVLPLGTRVNLTMSLNLRSLFHLLSIRGAADVQYETRQIADQLHDELWSVAPMSAFLYDEHGPFQNAP